MSIVVCQEKNTYLHYFIFPLNFPGLLKSEGGQGKLPFRGGNSWMGNIMNFMGILAFSFKKA
jgi:hypothetical protein